MNLLLLCCDADYEPEVLGDLTAADRYALWCMINVCSPETVHAEGSTQTCQQLAVASAFHSKLKATTATTPGACTVNTIGVITPESNVAPSPPLRSNSGRRTPRGCGIGVWMAK